MPKIYDDIYGYAHPLGASSIIYALKDGSDIDLVDSGVSILGVQRWLWKEMRKDGLEPTNIRRIAHCHVHFDHIQADAIFQQKAKKNYGNIEIFFPKLDAHRFSPDFHILKSNFQELGTQFPNYPFNKIRGTRILAQALAEPLVQYKIPSNLHPYNHEEEFQLGNYRVKSLTTGGHTDGHSYLFIDSPLRILFNSDSGCINEFTSNWIDVIKAFKLELSLKPDYLLGGHDNYQTDAQHSEKDIRSGLNRMDNIVKGISMQMLPNHSINLNHLAWRRVNWLYKIPMVELWALMTVYCCAKYLESKRLGQLRIDQTGSMIFDVTNTDSKRDLLEQMRLFHHEKEQSISIQILSLLEEN